MFSLYWLWLSYCERIVRFLPINVIFVKSWLDPDTYLDRIFWIAFLRCGVLTFQSNNLYLIGRNWQTKLYRAKSSSSEKTHRAKFSSLTKKFLNVAWISFAWSGENNEKDRHMTTTTCSTIWIPSAKFSFLSRPHSGMLRRTGSKIRNKYEV